MHIVNFEIEIKFASIVHHLHSDNLGVPLCYNETVGGE